MTEFCIIIIVQDHVAGLLRLGLSSLKSHLFKFNLCLEPFCVNCVDEIESSVHYLLVCPCYTGPRKLFLSKLETFVPGITKQHFKKLCNYCLNGIIDADVFVNRNILNITSEFVRNSHRFNF